MAGLPGWDRHRLDTADPADVAAARMIVYATALAPAVQAPLQAQIDVLEIGMIEKPASRRKAERDHNLRRRRELRHALGDQRRVRAALELDEPLGDEPEDDE